LPKTLHVDTPSTHVDWTSGAVELLTEPRAWTTVADRPRRAAVSSFGISGTNAHVILEQAPPDTETPDTDPVPVVKSDAVVWVLSGRSGEGLLAQGRRLQEWL
ncbi:ketoacyl-synthetase C-terminal extension domain-containing protein, partial [Nocardia noduli]|uniref:ketoacyl-synthetase C-terminal extension domain-containing protein n=1 Tax=Nocardia noduli TaxID=2815722 RepID=UPI0027E0B6B4